jgi:predicted deacylase
VPVVNVPGYHRNQRLFNDGADLNRTFPGKEGGTNSQVFAWRFLDRIVRHFHYLIDLHTASFGRVNSLYVRADLRHEPSRDMANALRPQILLHNRGQEGTLRDAAMDLGIPSVTVEVGNPQRIQDDLVWWSVAGIRRIMDQLGMLPETILRNPPWEPVICGRSYWLYTDRGGILEVFPPLVAHVIAGERIAHVRDVFGSVIRDYFSPESGVVIGHSTNPVNQTGSRILHLGIVGDPEPAPTAPDEE